jgi:hypothetical protein
MSLDAWRRNWARLDWVEELLYLCILATGACIVYPWQLLLSTALGYDGMSLLGLCVLFWLPYLVVSALHLFQMPGDRRQALIVACALLTALLGIWFHVYGPGAADGSAAYPVWDLVWLADAVDRLFSMSLVVPPEVFTTILVLIGWWRGIVASRHEYETQQVWFRFRLGVILLFAYFLVTLFGQRLDLSGLILAFFFFGLMSIALASVIESGGVHRSTLGSGQWVGMLGGTILGSLGVALLISLLLSRQMLRAVLAWLEPVVRAAQYGVWLVLSAVLYLLWPLIEWATEWIRHLDWEQIPFNVSPLMSPLATPQELLEAEETATILPACRAIFVIVGVVVGLLLVVRAVRRLSRQQAERRGLERESLWSGQDFADDLRNSLRQGWDQIRALAGQFGGRRHRSAATIRRLYASMVDLATEAGYPRRPAETPYEYRPTLDRAYPQSREAVDAITEAYVRVHYGEVPESRAEMDRLVEYWEQLQTQVVPRTLEEGS